MKYKHEINNLPEALGVTKERLDEIREKYRNFVKEEEKTINEAEKTGITNKPSFLIEMVEKLLEKGYDNFETAILACILIRGLLTYNAPLGIIIVDSEDPGSEKPGGGNGRPIN